VPRAIVKSPGAGYSSARFLAVDLLLALLPEVRRRTLDVDTRGIFSPHLDDVDLVVRRQLVAESVVVVSGLVCSIDVDHGSPDLVRNEANLASLQKLHEKFPLVVTSDLPHLFLSFFKKERGMARNEIAFVPGRVPRFVATRVFFWRGLFSAFP